MTRDSSQNSAGDTLAEAGETPSEDEKSADETEPSQFDDETVSDSEPAPTSPFAPVGSSPDSTDDAQDEDLGAETDTPESDRPQPSDRPRSTDAAVPAPVRPPAQPRKSSGFFPMLLGGVIAGGIGYAVGSYYPLTGNTDADALRQEVAAQSDRIAALDDRIGNLPPPDLSDLEGRLTELADQTAAQVTEVQEQLSQQTTTFEDRLTALEKQPNADGTLSDAALEAYQRELEDLRAEMEAQQETVLTAAAQAEADLAAARAEAEALEQEAVAAAEAAAARAALNRIAAAVETGAPFEDALNDLKEADVAPVLSDAAPSGVATQAELIAAFPQAARDALATARAEGQSDDAAGLGGFLRSQFDVRSTAPRDGTGPDAVLSRAEAAVKEGRIDDALAELEALPEVARAEMTDWTARATERADVLDAIAALSETYN
ncbi:hypothetical protein DC363_03075 [Thalassorhabdomicrobium marinisediminis]|uniref:Mitochondrial inner membrane protein n=1 Tax=Thalassorhabdomicrobium marinisediminis TaxID=2170577 RepID=A0A2T7FZN8_9RHOB|nr:hypothetical protein DC363_03075 [Thalassorhabdomicrobium marinisediminis]